MSLRLHLATAAVLALAVPSGIATTNPFGLSSTTGCCKPCNQCPGDSQGTGDVTLDAGGFLFASGTGLSTYPKPTSFTGIGNTAYENDHSLPSFRELVDRYFPSSPLQRAQVEVKISQPWITATLYHPACLTLDSEARLERRTRTYDSKDYLHQIVTDDAFTQIDILPKEGTREVGWKMRTWRRDLLTAFGESGGYFTATNLGSATPLTTVTFRRPAGTDSYDTLYVITKTATGLVGSENERTTTTKIVQELGTNGRPSQTISSLYDGVAATGTPLSEETITYSYPAGAKKWDRTITRTVKVAPSPILTSYTLITTSVSQETYRDYSLVASEGGEPGMMRLMSRTLNGLTTTYDYYDDTSVAFSYARRKSEIRPDKYWTFWDYYSGTALVLTEYSSWLDLPITSKASARKTVTTVNGATFTTDTYVANRVVAKAQTTLSGQTVTASQWDAAATPSAWLPSVTTYYPDSYSDPSVAAGRVKSIVHSDGTLTTYGYAGIYDTQSRLTGMKVSVKSGAADAAGTGVGDGTETVTTYNLGNIAVAQESKDIKSQKRILSAIWNTDATSGFDALGRPIRRYFGDNTDDYEITKYACCGIAEHRGRDGTTTVYTRDALKRVTGETATPAGGSGPVTVSTTLSQPAADPQILTTAVTRAGGGTTLLVSKTTRSLDGLNVTIESPDADGDANPETTTSVTFFNSGGGTTTTTTHPDATTTATSTFRDGQTASSTDQESHITTYTYGTHGTSAENGGLWSKTTSPVTTQWIKTYTDQLGRTFKTEYPDGAITSSTYHGPSASKGSRGKLATTTDPDENANPGTGSSVNYFYNVKGENFKTTEALADGQTRTTLTETQVLASTTNPVIIHGITINPAITTTTSVNGVPVSTTYRSLNGLTSGSDSFGRRTVTVRTVPADGKWTVTSVDADGVQTRRFYVDGLEKVTVSFESGEVLPSTEPTDITTFTMDGFISGGSQTHDAFGRVLTTKDSRTGTTTYTDYLENGAVTSVTTNGGSDTTSYTYDAMGRVAKTILPNESETYTSYTDRGQVKATWGSQTYPTYRTYDAIGRQQTLHTWRSDSSLDLSDGASTTELAASSTTAWAYDSQRGWLETKRDAETKGADYTYTLSGRLKTRTWARGLVTTYGYDHGMLESVDYWNSSALLEDYESALETLAEVENDPNSTQQEIDDAQSAVDDAYAAAADTTPSLAYTYDDFGRIETVKQGGQDAAGYGYTGLLLTSEDLNQNTLAKTLNRHYDALLRPMSLEVSGEYTTGYDYDTAGRLWKVWDHPTLAPGTKAPSGTAFTYGYRAKSYGLLAAVGGPAHTVTNTWEATRDVLDTKINEKTVGTASIPSSFNYGVNNIGKRETLGPVLDASDDPVSTYNPAWTWGYNARGELVSATDDTTNGQDRGYIYDSIGNRLATGNVYSINAAGVESVTNSVAYTPNDLNQYTVANGVTLPTIPTPAPYDPDGNLRFDGGVNLTAGTATPAEHQYVWDAENRLIAVNKLTRDEDDAIIGTTTLVTYAYDHLSRLVVRTTTAENTTEGATTTRYLYDGWNRIAEYSGQTLKKTYTWGMDLSGSMQGAGGVGGLLALRIHGTGDDAGAYFPTYDGNGNISEYLKWIQDADTGTFGDQPDAAVAAHFEYDPFGNTLPTSTGNTGLFSYRFSTKPLDFTTGLYYYGYRWYDPLTGRWPSRDPIEEEGGTNLYGFVGNNGVDRADLYGAISRDAAQTKFDAWYAKEKARGIWWERMGIPRCPCKCKKTMIKIECRDSIKEGNGGVYYREEERIEFDDSMSDFEKGQWKKPGPILKPWVERFHPGAIYEMRSKDNAGSSNQCTYDKDCNLITEPPAMGTVDSVNPGRNRGDHWDNDVYPVILAAYLDGQWEGGTSSGGNYTSPTHGRMKGGVGDNLTKYFEVRPCYHKNCPKNPK
jgi:RHS repeat-associated protein